MEFIPCFERELIQESKIPFLPGEKKKNSHQQEHELRG
jgi:hypothetical protein